jgi:hypothetical protein
MFSFGLKAWRNMVAVSALMLLAACGDQEKPAALPPPPPAAQPKLVIPARPSPPDHASPILPVPPLLANGLRQSVNRNILPAQTIWNLRAAYNVAALNCAAQGHSDIVVNYRAFLKAQAKGLAAANRAVDAEFRQKYGARFVIQRETFMTEVYNHFANPPTMPAFCDALLAVSREAKLMKPAELDHFAQRSLPSIEVVFDDFYRRYDLYRAAVADWEQRYGAAYPQSGSGIAH